MRLTLDELADRFNHAAVALPRHALDAEKRTLTDARIRAEFWSSGGESLAAMRKDDHPHARRHGHRRRDRTMINRQSGEFAASWDEEPPTLNLFGTEARLHNAAPHARYLFDPDSEFADGGTRFMFGRDVPAQIESDISGRRELRHVEALLRSFR